ncbi:acyl CoA:acetate/3-ketoacid CoA transferase [Paenibacillus sp. Leaf72]|uniref:acyl CoA:acetate/3-ketoacid CoA transferase n=1 Tax=Paenibacillus sp. Leaf72 TaxID=1736234 RepID=UPI0006F599F2|nr:CoA-transferase [Paenibacillus sp. Leaf72]KQO08460.1 acetate CoA-transferase YdiF [Paenibacillus sp. Leaf72]
MSNATLKKRTGPVPVLTAEEAVRLIPDGATVAFSGAGGGIVEATAVIEALADRYHKEQQPSGLTYLHTTGLGDRADRGMSPIAIAGLCAKAIGGHWGQSPRMSELAETNQIEAYCFPQGVITQLFRSTAAGHPGILSHVGLGSFVDPRQQGGKLNEHTTKELVRLMEIDGKEWLFYPSIKPDVAIIRGTTADTDGYITMEDEPTFLDVLSIAQATKNSGGIVIVQVQRMVQARSQHPKTIKIPGFLVDAVVVVPEQMQTYQTESNRYMSGDLLAVQGGIEPLQLTERKIIARRALMEAFPGAVANLGVGISDGVGYVAAEEGVGEALTFTVELGPIGGTPAKGIIFGATISPRAVLDQPYQFDFYDGGGLDVSFLSFAEMDQAGNVNVHKFNGKIMGVGGFIDIAQNSKKVVFSGTFTTGGLSVQVNDGKVDIAKEGRFRKIVPALADISFNGIEAAQNGKEVIFITERAVFQLTARGLMLCEIAPGIDLQRDILDLLAFEPLISPELKLMDARLFQEEPMGLKQEWNAATV